MFATSACRARVDVADPHRRATLLTTQMSAIGTYLPRATVAPLSIQLLPYAVQGPK